MATVPPWAWPLTAVLSHLSNSSWVTVVSPTFATAPGGTSLPQPAMSVAPTAVIASESRSLSETCVIRTMSRAGA
jgi:hypothetical protein